jgi:hypothetical protein
MRLCIYQWLYTTLIGTIYINLCSTFIKALRLAGTATAITILVQVNVAILLCSLTQPPRQVLQQLSNNVSYVVVGLRQMCLRRQHIPTVQHAQFC